MLGHVPAIGERLVFARRIMEARDSGAVQLGIVGRAGRRGRDNFDVDTLRAERGGEAQQKPAGHVAIESRKGVREEENFHVVQLRGFVSRSAVSSSSRRRTSRNSARWPATCSPNKPVAKNTLPSSRQV